jgi:DNA-binding NtrC family response regulator
VAVPKPALWPAVEPAQRGELAGAEPMIKPLSEAVAELEGRAIREAMAATGGNKLAASRLLGISRATLYEKLALVRRSGTSAAD